MDTDKLIGDLTKDLKPVRVLRSPLVRTIALSLSAMALIGLSIVLFGARVDVASIVQTPGFIFDNALIFASGALAAFAAFHLAVPDTKIRKSVLVSLLFAVAAWMGLGAFCLEDLTHAHHAVSWDHDDLRLVCIRNLAILIALPAGASIALLAQGAPVWRGWAGFGMILSVGSFGAVAMRVLCASDDPAHLFLAHYLPVAAFAVAGIGLGKMLLRFSLKTPASPR